MRGATAATKKDQAMVLGLSPLARGNQGLDAKGVPLWGPIPACAGQPICDLT